MEKKYGNRKLPGGVTVDKNGYVHVRLFHNNVLAYRKEFGHVAEPKVLDNAIAKRNEVKQQLSVGKFQVETKTERITIETALDWYWDHHGSKMDSFKSTRSYIKDIKDIWKGKFFDALTYLDTKELRRLLSTREYVTDRKDARYGQPLAESTINRYLTMIIHMYNCFAGTKNDPGWIELKVVPNIKLPVRNPGHGRGLKKTDEKPFARTRVLSVEEFQAFFANATMRLRRQVLMAVNTLLRLEDLEALTISKNVNWSEMKLVGMQGKVNKPYAIEINPVVKHLIDTAEGDKILDCTNHRREVAEACRLAGIKDFEFSKDCRRTGATWMLRQGADIRTVQEILGHQDVRMTMIYTPPAHAQKQTAVDGLAATFGGAVNFRQNCGKTDKVRMDGLTIYTPEGESKALIVNS